MTADTEGALISSQLSAPESLLPLIFPWYDIFGASRAHHVHSILWSAAEPDLGFAWDRCRAAGREGRGAAGEAPVCDCKAMSFFPVNLVISCFRAQQSEGASGK